MYLTKIILLFAFMGLIISPAIATTNNYPLIRSTTAELSNGAWSQEASITGDEIRFNGDQSGRYISNSFYVPNLVSGSVSSYMESSSSTLDYAWLYSNSQWINSTDERQLFRGHAYYSIRYPFTDDAIGGYTADAWFVDSADSINNCYLYNGAYIWGSGSESCLRCDGVNDYARTSFDFNYDDYFTIAAMVQPTSEGTMLSVSSSSTVANMELKYIESTTNYLKLRIVDSSNNIIEYADSSKSVSKDSWHYIVIYCDSINIYVYCDGVFQFSGAFNIGAGDMNMNYITFGGVWFNGALYNLGGCYIDEFRFHQGGFADNCASLASLSSAQSVFMWNEVYGVNNSKKSSYKLTGAGSIYLVAYSCYDNPLSPHYNYIYDISTTILNTAPTVAAVWPKDDLVYDTNPTVVLTVEAYDADISYITPTTAQFYIDDVIVGSNTRDSDGQIQYNSGTYTGGTHTWKALVYDPWGGSVLTQEETFNVLSTLYIRDESDPDTPLNASVKVNFYTENLSISRTSTDGTISLTGLPITNLLVTASADGYYDRKTIITSLYDTQNIYLINHNQSVIYNQFKLNSQSITYPITEYWIDVQKPINGSVGTVFSSYFGFDGSCGTYLIGSDVYRLVIHSPDGTSISYGWLYPDPDGTMEITITGTSGAEMVTDWLSSGFTVNEDANTIQYSYSSTKGIESGNFRIKEHNTTIQDYSIDTETGNFIFTSDANKHNYEITITLIADDGEVYEITRLITLNEGNLNPFPTSYPEWFKQVIVSAIAILCILAFSSYRADVGCIMGAGVFCTAYIFEWFPISQAVIYTIILIAAAAVIKFKRKQERVLY